MFKGRISSIYFTTWRDTWTAKRLAALVLPDKETVPMCLENLLLVLSEREAFFMPKDSTSNLKTMI